MITHAVFPWEKEFKSKSKRWIRHFCTAVVQPQGCFKYALNVINAIHTAM